MTDPRRRRVALGASLVALLLFGPGLYQMARLSIEQHRLDRRIATLDAAHERLEQRAARLESDPAYVEGLIRTTFKLAKPGEVVIPLESRRSPQDGR